MPLDVDPETHVSFLDLTIEHLPVDVPVDTATIVLGATVSRAIPEELEPPTVPDPTTNPPRPMIEMALIFLFLTGVALALEVPLLMAVINLTVLDEVMLSVARPVDVLLLTPTIFLLRIIVALAPEMVVEDTAIKFLVFPAIVLLIRAWLGELNPFPSIVLGPV